MTLGSPVWGEGGYGDPKTAPLYDVTPFWAWGVEDQGRLTLVSRWGTGALPGIGVSPRSTPAPSTEAQFRLSILERLEQLETRLGALAPPVVPPPPRGAPPETPLEQVRAPPRLLGLSPCVRGIPQGPPTSLTVPPCPLTSLISPCVP